MEPAKLTFFAALCCERATFVAIPHRFWHYRRRSFDCPHDHSTEFQVIKMPFSTEERESGAIFAPKFDRDGLLTAVVTDASGGEVLVVAHMNRAAIDHTLESGNVTFWSRSRQCLWTKGETSGNVLRVVEVLVDCDQDALLIRADPAGPTCHTGARSCFYRRLEHSERERTLVKVKT